MARDKKILVRCSDEEYAKLEALAAKKFDCSMAEAARTSWTELFFRAFGDLDADALLDGRIDDADVEALNEGDLTHEDFSEDVRDVDGDQPDLTVSADGGVKPSPNSYQATYGPQDVANSGPELPWNKLSDTVDLYWSDTLEVHPDRVPTAPSESQLKSGDPNRLKQVNRVTPKVIAGMCRSVATNEVVPGDTLTTFIDDYLSHLNRRKDQAAGREHLHANYRERVGEYLYAHPDPAKDVFYTSESKLAEIVDDAVREPFGTHTESHPDVFNFDRWCRAVASNDARDGTREEWHADLGRWVERVAMLQTVRLGEQYQNLTAESTLDLSETDYNDVNHYLTRLVVSLCDEYRRTVNTTDRETVQAEYVCDEAISVLQDLL